MGTGIYGWALLDDVPVWYELWRQINGFPPNYLGDAPAYPVKDGKKAKASTSTDNANEE